MCKEMSPVILRLPFLRESVWRRIPLSSEEIFLLFFLQKMEKLNKQIFSSFIFPPSFACYDAPRAVVGLLKFFLGIHSHSFADKHVLKPLAESPSDLLDWSIMRKDERRVANSVIAALKLFLKGGGKKSIHRFYVWIMEITLQHSWPCNASSIRARKLPQAFRGYKSHRRADFKRYYAIRSWYYQQNNNNNTNYWLLTEHTAAQMQTCCSFSFLPCFFSALTFSSSCLNTWNMHH